MGVGVNQDLVVGQEIPVKDGPAHSSQNKIAEEKLALERQLLQNKLIVRAAKEAVRSGRRPTVKEHIHRGAGINYKCFATH
jgi:hypothetical protein